MNVIEKLGTAIHDFRMAASPKKNRLVSILEEKQLDRVRQDVGKWRQALMLAENVEQPDREELYRLYEDLVLDNHLTSVMEKRKLSVLAKPFRIVSRSTGEEDKNKTMLLQKPWFWDFCTHALDSRFWGHSLIEFGDVKPGKNGPELSEVVLIPREHVIPEEGIVRQFIGDIKGIPYREGPVSRYLVEVGSRRDLGLLKKAGPPVLWKKNGSTAWAEYTQIFGMPLRKATSSNFDKGSRAKLENMLKKMGQAAYVILEDGENVDFVETSSTDAYMVFDKLIERNNSELSKLIIGQTMTTDNGSSRSQSEVHERVADNYTAADKFLLASVINESLIPKLRAIGYKFGADDVFEWDESESLGLLDLWKVVEGIVKTSRYKVPADYITKTFGVPVEEQELPQPAPVGGPGAGKHLEPTMKSSRSSNVDPKRGLGLGSEVPKTIEYRVPAFLNHSVCCDLHMKGNEQEFKSIAGAFKALLDEVWGGSIKFSKLYFNTLADTLLEAFRNGWDPTGLPTDVAADMLKLMEANIFQFSAGKTLSLVKQLNDLSIKADSFDTFRASVDLIDTDYNQNYLRTEYNFTRAAAQNGARWLRQKAEADIYPFLRWRTVGDANVRASHAALDGKVWDIRKGAPVPYPPADWNCRCEMEQLPPEEVDEKSIIGNDQVKTFFNAEEWQRMEESGMLANRGETGEIFTANQMYVSRLSKEAKEAVKEREN